MSETAHLRTVITGLPGFAATEEEMLLAWAGGRGEDAGNERLWAALPAETQPLHVLLTRTGSRQTRNRSGKC